MQAWPSAFWFYFSVLCLYYMFSPWGYCYCHFINKILSLILGHPWLILTWETNDLDQLTETLFSVLLIIESVFYRPLSGPTLWILSLKYSRLFVKPLSNSIKLGILPLQQLHRRPPWTWQTITKNFWRCGKCIFVQFPLRRRDPSDACAQFLVA